MRHVVGAVAVGIAVLAIYLAVAMAQPKAHAELHNPYWPFSVEIQVRDK